MRQEILYTKKIMYETKKKILQTKNKILQIKYYKQIKNTKNKCKQK